MRPTRPRQFGRPCGAHGTVLIVTMWVVLVLAGLALVFARSIRVATILAANHVASIEADQIAAGACQYIIAQLMAAQEEGRDPIVDCEAPYEALRLGNGYFWVLRPRQANNWEYGFGLTDETGKINLNTASEEMLLLLPGMTSELAASIIDWRSEETEESVGGAGDEYYLLLPEPYNCKNAPLETVEELLLIRGASPELLYGADFDREGMLDGDQSHPLDIRYVQRDTGLYDYVTVYSVEANIPDEENALINVNDAESRADIEAALQEIVDEERVREIMNAIPANPDFANILEFYSASGMTTEEFAGIADQLTTSDDETRPGLVNVNTAPKEVLMCLPELEEQDVDALISYRESDNDLSSVAWVANALDAEKVAAIGNYITVNSYQYSADILCLSGDGRAYKRYRAVFDIRAGKPQIIYWKSISHLGWPLDPEIVATLRKGEPLSNVITGIR